MACININININLDINLVDCIKLFKEEIIFIICPQKKKKKLERKMEELKRMQKDITDIILQQKREKPGTECKVVVKSWLDKVNDTEKEVNDLLDSLAQRCSSTCCCSPPDGRNVEDLITEIHSVVEEGSRYVDGELVGPIPDNPIDNVPDLSTPMVGRDGTLSNIHDYLRDSQVQTIGICGTGGIGKTTLLKSIKDELVRNHDFFYIVWIEMSQNVDILNTQKQIASCISLTLQPKEEQERAKILINALRRKKSLILIDNMWNMLEYERIGIPFSVGNDFHKIVFTTRSQRVCTDMRAQIVKLGYLDEADSLQLFQNNISSVVDLQLEREHIDEILKRCGGLPLVILTVARTVANYTLDAEWNAAVDCLRNSPAEIEGMDDVMKCLKFSYDKLENDEIRSCLLYFSLYPESENIRTDELIKLWLGEGLLDMPNNNSFRKSYHSGHLLINKLKSICLVESGFSDDVVKVHDVIRGMLSLISENENEEVFLVYKYLDDKSNGYNRWDLAKGVYLDERQLKRLPEKGMPSCPNLTSLIVQSEVFFLSTPSLPFPSCPNLTSLNAEYEAFFHSTLSLPFPTEDFFHFTPSLRVLDLSYTGLVDIPKSIGELVELRYLNLYRTLIKMVPMELGNLKKLKCLDLGGTFQLERIVNVAISQLSLLQSLNLFNTKYQWNSDVNTTTQPLLMLEDLRELKNLEELGVNVSLISHLNSILDNQTLSHSVTRIKFVNIDFTKEGLQLIKLISERFLRLMKLVVDGCALQYNILEIKGDHQLDVEHLRLWNLEISSVIMNDGCRPLRRLKILEFSNCQCLKEVSWTAHIPSLQELYVSFCNGVEELVVGEEEIEEQRDCYFPKLRILAIKELKNLHSIHWRRPFLFPALKRLFIENCPKLKQLSLGHDSAKDMELIVCEQSQWESLKWENDQVQSRFLPYFRALFQKFVNSC